MEKKEEKKELVKKIADKAKDMEPFKNKVTEDLRYSQACLDLRAKMGMLPIDENIRKVPCDSKRVCYREGCPIFTGYTIPKVKDDDFPNVKNPLKLEKKESKAKVTKDNPLGINLDVYEEIEPDKPKKAKKISKEVEEFLYLQSRVISKLSWNPQIWKALDDLSISEILDRLLGKTGLEGVATHVGGDMTLKASPTTKKLFKDLEKQFAEEDEKKGKGAPPNYENGSADKKFVDFSFESHDQGFYEAKYREDSSGYFEKVKKEEKNVDKK